MESKYAGLEATAELVTQLKGITGDKELLNTTDKSTLVAAVNELYNSIFDVTEIVDNVVISQGEYRGSADSNYKIIFKVDSDTYLLSGSNNTVRLVIDSDNSSVTVTAVTVKFQDIIRADDNSILGAYLYGDNARGLIKRSIDGGATWSDVATGADFTCLSKFSDGALIAGTCNNGVFISSDNGETWANTQRLTSGGVENVIAIGSRSVVCCRNKYGVYYIDDITDSSATLTKVISWAYSTPLANVSQYPYFGFYTAPNGNIIAYPLNNASSAIGSSAAKTYVSKDNGNTFIEASTSVYTYPKVLGSRLIAAGGASYVAYSDDNGETWQSATGVSSDVYSLTTNDTICIVSTSGSTYFSIDGITYSAPDSGNVNKAYSLLLQNDSRIIAGYASRIGVGTCAYNYQKEVKPKWETAIEALAAQLNA